MLRRVLPNVIKTTNNSLTKKFSTDHHEVTDVTSWVKIYKEMRNEAASAADLAVSNVRSDVATVRSEMKSLRSEMTSEINVLKSDVSILKSDVGALKSDVHSLRHEVHDIYKQINNTTRILLTAMFGSVTAGIAVSQYLNKKEQPANGLDDKVATVKPKP